MFKHFIAGVLTALLLLTACSSQSESSPLITYMITEPASPQPTVSLSDSCDAHDQMQLSLSTAVSNLITNPDLVTAFESEFENQVALLNELIASL